MKDTYKSYKEQIAEVSRRIGELGYTTSQGGNISCIADDGSIIITPTKRNKRTVIADEVCVVDDNGTPIIIKDGTGVTSELPMHMHIFDIRKDVKAIIHAHPPVSTGFAIAHSDLLEKAVLPESCMELGPVLSVPYVDPGSKELAIQVGEAIKKTNAVIMQNHGVLVVSDESVERALEMLELLEATAVSLVTATQLGTIRVISDDDIRKIAELYKIRGVAIPGKEGYYKDASEAFGILD